jgi:ATP-dependent Clp protease ATP-binding subunit ClpA
LSEDDLGQVFELEITDYEREIFPGQAVSISFENDAKERLFDEATAGLGLYGVHALRRVLQRHIDPVVYRAYNQGTLTEGDLDQHRIIVDLDADEISVQVA